MAPKYITSSRSLLLSSSPSPLPSTESMKPSSTTFHKNLPNILEGQQGYQIAPAEHIHLTALQDTFTSFMFPPFLVSIAGALMKGKSTYLRLYKAKLTSDVVLLSSSMLSNGQRFSAVRFVPASQLSLLWRTPWTYATFGRAYASAAESRKREIRVSDEEDDDNNGGAEEPSEFEEDSDVEDEQRIEDSDDDEEEDEGDQEPQSQGLPKKIQTKPPKSKRPDQQGRVLNEKITARTLRLVNDNGKGHRIVSRDEALTLAKGKKMDLVQVDGRADPPVCKIFDFNKEEYKQEQILKDRKKQKGVMSRLNEVKELRFNSKTEPKDLRMKVEQAKEFMSRGYRVKFVAIFKGKLDDEKKRLEEEKMIDAVYPMMEDVAAIEQGPRVESRQAWVMFRHAKFAKKKPPKHEPQIKAATEKVESVKQGDHAFSEPDFYEGQEGNIMHAQNGSNISETAAMGRLQGYPSKPIAPPTQPMAFRSPHPQVQSPQLQDTVEAFSSKMYSPPLHGFPQHAQSLEGFGGLKGSEMAISSPPDPLPSILSVQRAGVQGAKIQSLHPSVSPLPASSLLGSEGTQRLQLKPSPLDGMSSPQSEQHPSHTPKIQMFSIPSQSQGILSQKESPNVIGAPLPEKANSSEGTQGEYPATSRGRGIPLPNQPSHSLFSPNLQGPLLNLSQSSPMPPARQMHDPSNLQGPLPNASLSTPVTSSHLDGLSNLESPLADFISSPPLPTPRHAPSSQGFHPDPSPFFGTQNVRERYSPPLQGSEGLGPQRVPRYPSPPSQGLPPQEVSRYPPPPIGQPRYTPPLGQPSSIDLQSPQGEFAPGNQNRQLQGPKFMQQMQSQLQPALEAAAQNSQEQNYRPMQGQDRYVPAPNLFGSPQHPQQVPPNQGSQQGPPSLFRSPLRPQQGPPNLVGFPQGPQKGPPSPFGSLLRPQQGPPGPVRSPQGPQQGPPNLFGSPPGPQQGPPSLFGSPPRPQQGPPSLVGSPQGPQQGPPSFFGSPPGPQQGPPSFFGSPPGPQQGPPGLFGSPLHPQQGPSEPSQAQSGHRPVGVLQGPRQGGPWLSQQGPPRYPPPVPSHPQQTGQPSPQGHQGYFAQQDAQGGSQDYWQSQASQGFPSQQNQAPQGYPPPRGFPQTRLAQGAFDFQGNQPQNQVSRASPSPRGFPQVRPVVPSPSGFQPSWSAPPPSQEYSPLFESPTDESGV